jgi:glutathione S-transferase
MADYDLHCFLESGNAYKVALMLTLANADWKPVRVSFFAGQTRSTQFRDMNVMGEVPVLIDHTQGDLALSQSGLILWHLADRFDQFAARNDDERREILRWLFWDNHKLTSYTATTRFMGHFQKKKDDPVTQFFAARAQGAYKVLEKHLAGRNWVAADRATIADLSICGYLFWPEQIGIDWKEYPNIDAWLKRIAALPGYKRPEELMPSGIDPQPQTA